MQDNIHTNSPAFLGKIVTMLKNENERVIRWNNDGDGIIISDIPKFSKELMPKYFKTKKFNSFIRQLNFYGFKKVCSATKTTRCCEFVHSIFKRGQEDLLVNIKRKNLCNISSEDTSLLEVERLRLENKTLKERLQVRETEYEDLLNRYVALERELENYSGNNSSGNNFNFIDNNSNIYNSEEYRIESSNILEELYGESNCDI